MSFFVFEERKPRVASTAFVDPAATVIGRVDIGQNCYIAPGARIKGDYGSIVIGDGSSVQENCVIHARPSGEAVIGANVTVGHGAIIHGGRIGPYTVIGMGAIVADEAEVGEFCIVAEGALVPNGAKIPPRSVVMGVPGEVVASVDEEREYYNRMGAEVYQGMCGRYREGLKEIDREDLVD